jgi:predicted transcriptional regulator
MPNIGRITIALDEETRDILERLAKGMGVSYSALIRAALKFFSQNREPAKNLETMKIWSELLSKGEHIILDIDHWLLFLEYIESSDKKESFYTEGKKVAKSHAEQLARVTPTPEEYLKRLEACNLFKLRRDSEGEYTLVLNSTLSKRFIKELVLETLTEMGFTVSVNEDLAKLRLKTVKRIP